MKIEEIYIEAFGCLENTRIKLEPGLNIITKDNEQGKTTAAEFIRALRRALPYRAVFRHEKG